MAIKKVTDLEVYNLAEDLAMDIFEVSKSFPKEETCSLTDQIRRSSRSIAVNIAEGWGKRHYENMFKKYLIDSLGSLEETKSWIRFSFRCEYINEEVYLSESKKLDELGAKVYRLFLNWKS